MPEITVKIPDADSCEDWEGKDDESDKKENV